MLHRDPVGNHHSESLMLVMVVRGRWAIMAGGFAIFHAFGKRKQRRSS